jgi:hypothetical protein
VRFLSNLQNNRVRDGLCMACSMWQLYKDQCVRENLRASESWKCGQGPQTPHNATKHLVLMCAKNNALFLQVDIMLMGIFRQAVLGLCKRTSHRKCLLQNISACQIEGYWPQDEHQNI